MTWSSAVQKCEEYGGGWRLPGPEDNKTMVKIREGMKKRRWRSVWTGVKMKMFDGFYWEDGSLQSKVIVMGFSYGTSKTRMFLLLSNIVVHVANLLNKL